ncbi:farnesyl pyrophosphate synthase-like [Coccinella septempunctata]|uniref:farnesyl pyrophosphate synthase-like n=1 Tax=Coccinella septempunctata TaxID=41139 RepID=UPI001D06DCA4|nr:farnesyl pyrophosphate synthase-like [Coccinella septempunctata]
MTLGTIRKCVSLFKSCNSTNLVSLHTLSESATLRNLKRGLIMDSSRPVSTFPEEKPKKLNLVSKKEIEEFEDLFPGLVNDLVTNEHFGNLTEVTSRFAKSLNYNVPHGKKNRGLAVVASYKILEKPENLTPENIKLANILGWLIEMLQAFLLVMDDVTDGSETRRGQPCWYKLENIGISAINDGIILENSVYLLLKKYFRQHPSYVYLMESFLDVTRKTIIGQILDCNIVDLDTLSMERFELIAYNKTAHYSFFLPVSLALYLANYTEPEVHQQVKGVLLEIGKYFQVQDDYLDCYGDPEITGKIGTDIETGKCTWLAAKALQIASADQKKIMEENYGKQDPENVRKIKDLYNELGIAELYAQYEEQSYSEIQSSILDLPKEAPQELLQKIVAVFYKRNA